MRSRIASLLLPLVFVACATTPQSDRDTADGNGGRTEIQVVQLSNVGAAARHQQGGIPVQYRISVMNRGAEPITLTRVAITSIGQGAYDVNQSSSFEARIEPAETKSVEMWAPANVSQSTIMGANGPVTIRATLNFNAASGTFQQIVTQQVSGMQGGAAQ